MCKQCSWYKHENEDVISGKPISLTGLRAEIQVLRLESGKGKMDKNKIVEELERILSMAKNGYG